MRRALTGRPWRYISTTTRAGHPRNISCLKATHSLLACQVLFPELRGSLCRFRRLIWDRGDRRAAQTRDKSVPPASRAPVHARTSAAKAKSAAVARRSRASGNPSAAPHKKMISRSPRSRHDPIHAANCCELSCFPAASSSTDCRAGKSSFLRPRRRIGPHLVNLDLRIMADSSDVVVQQGPNRRPPRLTH